MFYRYREAEIKTHSDAKTGACIRHIDHESIHTKLHTVNYYGVVRDTRLFQRLVQLQSPLSAVHEVLWPPELQPYCRSGIRTREKPDIEKLDFDPQLVVFVSTLDTGAAVSLSAEAELLGVNVAG